MQNVCASVGARTVDAPAAVVHHEVSRLVDASVLGDSRQGRSRLVRADPDYRLLRPLSELITCTYGPVPVLTRELAEVPGIEARTSTAPGPVSYTHLRAHETDSYL